MRLTLVQAGRPDAAVSGTLSLKVDGAAGGGEVSHELTSLTEKKQPELPFNFRYYENFEQEIALPEGFTPERVTVVVRAARKGVTPLTQSFAWKVDAA